MWHKPEVYTTIRHPFTLAWREFVRSNKADIPSADALYARHKAEIVDDIARHARVPSLSSPRIALQMVVRPWEIPHPTNDDGILEMGVQEIKKACLQWLNANASRLSKIQSI